MATSSVRLFKFECTLCGKCCTGDQTVKLNPEDLRLLAEFHGLDDSLQLRKAGIIEDSPDGDPRPRIRFKRKPIKQCPHLINRVNDNDELTSTCELHPHFKPLVCHLSPLAREVTIVHGKQTETWSAVAPAPDCPGMGRGKEHHKKAPPELQKRLDDEAEWMLLQLTKVNGD